MDKQQSLFFKKYTDLLYRWRWFIIIVFLVSLPAGLAVYLLQPKEYQATSLISYQQQTVNTNKMSLDDKTKIEESINTLSQIVVSRNNLEQLIKQLDLYSEELEKHPVEDVIETMRENITLTHSRKGNTFLIVYTGDNRHKVVKVTNALAAKFMVHH